MRQVFHNVDLRSVVPRHKINWSSLGGLHEQCCSFQQGRVNCPWTRSLLCLQLTGNKYCKLLFCLFSFASVDVSHTTGVTINVETYALWGKRCMYVLYANMYIMNGRDLLHNAF
jgi:hypothetical protein